MIGNDEIWVENQPEKIDKSHYITTEDFIRIGEMLH